jgi:hypothetical protein
MAWEAWLAENWFELAQTLSIVAGLFFGAQSIRQNTKTRRLTNLLTVTSSHRELSLHFLKDKKLSKTFDPKRNLSVSPITAYEEQYVILHILHLKSAYETMKDGMAIHKEGLIQDLAEFFSLPLPRRVWSDLKQMYEPEFVEFVEKSRTRSDDRGAEPYP